MSPFERDPRLRGPITAGRLLKSKSQAKRRTALGVCLAGLALFLVWQAVSLGAFIRADAAPPPWDQAIHLEIARDYRDLIGSGRWSEAWRLPPKPGMPPFPPLYQLGVAAAQGLLGAGDDPRAAAAAALWLNGLYLALLCAAVFGIAWEFRGDETALVAVVLFACSPGIQYLAHTQLADLAVVAWSAAAYWAYFRSRAFADRAGSVLLGIAFAAGMLHKWSFFSYFLPVYLSAALALRDPARRGNALLAALLGAALPAPWYLTHLAVLLPRLFQATSDFATPFWKGGAFAFYFFDMVPHLGPVFWFLGWVGVVVPDVDRRSDERWLLVGSVLAAYVFWTIVPNRQIRFLLPGLPALAVLALGRWPKALLWAAAGLQLFLSANFAAGWVAPRTLSFGGLSVQCFPQGPPAGQDWRIADILKEAARRKPPDAPFADVTLVANAERFNGPNFTWTAKVLGLPLRLRGVNRRLCEFSRFVVLKRGELGPRGVIEGLPEAAAELERPGGWFQAAFREAGRWPLPDASDAVLYEQRPLEAPPLGQAAYRISRLATPFVGAENLRIQTGPWDPAASAYSWLRLEADALELRGLRVVGAVLELRGVSFVPVDAPGARIAPGTATVQNVPAAAPPASFPADVRFLKLASLRVSSAAVSAADLKGFVERRVPGLKIERLELDGDVAVQASFRGMTLSARAAPALSDFPRGLTVVLEEARLGPVPLPLFLLGPYRRVRVSFDPNPETPFSIDVPGLTVRNGWLRIP